MNLRTQTASLVNHLHARGVIGQPEPTVGMGVTLLKWTDRDAGTIQAVYTKSGATFVEVTQDDAELVDRSTRSESQDWRFTPCPNAHRLTFKRQPDGIWQEMQRKFLDFDDAGEAVYSKRLSKPAGGGIGLRIGERDKYRDPSF